MEFWKNWKKNKINKADINDKATVTHLISVSLAVLKYQLEEIPLFVVPVASEKTSLKKPTSPSSAPFPRLSCDAVCPVTKESRDHVEHDNF